MACPHNLANNRQTRMLANLSMVGCYNQSAMTPQRRDAMLLQSAKENLRDMAFFGVMEQQLETQFLFEQTFHLEFIQDFVQYNSSHATSVAVGVQSKLLERIKQTNHLDMQLYEYAKQLFNKRYLFMRDQAAKSSHSANVKLQRDVTVGGSLSSVYDDDDNTDADGNEYNDLNLLRNTHLSSKLRRQL